ncbi:hypothetical protein MMIC_P0186 [Mariprofundus micogutta]|uniref:Lipoprotein n=1 Tax=Mariprofundus micogutta TaxID=1921010 RepID=A0A1L8CK17_9PROT|nr:hypothetical protein [Mariprofundus micogutta]GAV19253.1 hypothetical protein MMIC_P0186 [Mariprofundus micogutta]
MHLKREMSLVSMFIFAALLAGCASQYEERQVNLKAIGEDICRDHGGLSSIDRVGPQAVYLCRHGMSYQLSTDGASTLLQTR